ncbi:MAG: glycosyltransferase family 2 protein [Anaerolineae bacterium]
MCERVRRTQRRIRRWLAALRREGLLRGFLVAYQRTAGAIRGLYQRFSSRHGERVIFPFIEPVLTLSEEPCRLTVIIPVMNGLAYVQECITALCTHPTDVEFEVIVIDQASTDGTREYLQAVADADSRIRLVENPVNVGFPRAINQGAALAHGDLLMILNSDVIIGPRCIDRLVSTLESDPRLAVVSPMTNYVGRGPQIDAAAAALKPDQIAEYAASIADRKLTQAVVDHLVFFCVLLRRTVFEFLGGISEVYGLGNYEDNDFCLRARLAGFSLAIVPSAFAFHYGSRTFKEQHVPHTRWMERNERFYFERVARLSCSQVFPDAHQVSACGPRITVAIDAADPTALSLTLTSLANQTTGCFDVVIVGDQNWLETVAAPFAQVLRLTYARPQSGREVVPWNAALGAGDGSWLTYLRAGDVLYPIHLESFLTHGDSDTPVVCTGLNRAVCWHSDRQDTVLARSPVSRAKAELSALSAKPLFPAPAFAHARSCLDQVGGFDPEFGPFADWDLLQRLVDRYEATSAEAISAEQRLYLRPGSGMAEGLVQLAEARTVALERIYERHPVEGSALLRLRRQITLDLQHKIRDLRWLTNQEGAPLSRAREMAAIWLETEV